MDTHTMAMEGVVTVILILTVQIALTDQIVLIGQIALTNQALSLRRGHQQAWGNLPDHK